MRANNSRTEQNERLKAMKPELQLTTVKEGMRDNLSAISSFAQDIELFRNYWSRFNDNHTVAVPTVALEAFTRSKSLGGHQDPVQIMLREASGLSTNNGYTLKKGSADTMRLNSRLQGRSEIKGGPPPRIEAGERPEKGMVSRKRMKGDLKTASSEIVLPPLNLHKPTESIDAVRNSHVVSVADKTNKLQARLQGRDPVTSHLYPQLQMKQYEPILVPRDAVHERQGATFEPPLPAADPTISYLLNMSPQVNQQGRVSLVSKMNADDKVLDTAGKGRLSPRLLLTNKRQFVKQGVSLKATEDVSKEVLRVGSEGTSNEQVERSYKLNRVGSPSQPETVGLPVININLNKQMIENFSIHTGSVERGLDDFREKVEKVLLEILNSVNVV